MEDLTIRLYDLLETRSFEELTTGELAFVLEHMTEEEYRSHSSINNAAAKLEYAVPEPFPLAVPEPQIPFWKRSVPLYQALTGAACIVLLVFVLLPRGKNETTIHYASIPVDTIAPVLSLNNAPDTIIRLIEVVKFHEKLVRDTLTIVQSVCGPQRETRMLEAGTLQYPSIGQAIEQSMSIPLSEDRTASLLPRMTNSGIFDSGK